MQANGGIQRGGLSKSDTLDTHHFCPTASLADCQPAANTGITLTAINQRPCVGITTPSSPLGKGTAGGNLNITWAGNGHTGVTGTCVSVYIAPFMPNPSFSDFTLLASCLPYGPIEANLTIPSNLPAGEYTVFWLWDFATFFFTSCIDMTITGAGGAPATTTKAPASTAKAPATTTKGTSTMLRTTTTAQPTSSQTGGSLLTQYLNNGCSNLPSSFCDSLFDESYCKNENKDRCGRSLCQGDSEENLTFPCPN